MNRGDRERVTNPAVAFVHHQEPEQEPEHRRGKSPHGHAADPLNRRFHQDQGRSGGRTEQPETRASKTDRDIQQLFARDDGTLWVLSSHGGFSTSDGMLATFDVYDRQGRFTRQVSMLGQGSFAEDGFHIVEDRLYVVTGLRSARRAMRGASDEDEEEVAEADPMSVICYDLSPIVQTLK